MSDRITSLILTFEEPLNAEDAQALIQTLRQLRGVADVSANVASWGHHAAVEQARAELRGKLLDILLPKRP